MQASLKKLDRGQLRDEVGEGHGITSYLRGMLADFSVNQPEDPSPVDALPVIFFFLQKDF